jgi:hypothetical protein
VLAVVILFSMPLLLRVHALVAASGPLDDHSAVRSNATSRTS